MRDALPGENPMNRRDQFGVPIGQTLPTAPGDFKGPSGSKRTVAHDVVAELAEKEPKAFDGFWLKSPDEQDELIKLYGTPSDRAFWSSRNG